MHENAQRQAQADVENGRQDEVHNRSDRDVPVFTDIQIGGAWKSFSLKLTNRRNGWSRFVSRLAF